MGGVDKKIEKDMKLQKEKLERKKARIGRQEELKKKYETEKEEENRRQKRAWKELETLDLGKESKERKEPIADTDFTPPTKQRRSGPDPLQVPRNVLQHPEVIEAQTRERVSPSALCNIFAAIVFASGGKIADYNCSSKHLTTEKNKTMDKISNDQKEGFVPPEIPIMMFDEKEVERYQVKEKRLAILIAGDKRPPQLVGSVVIPNGKGSTVAESVMEEGEKYGVGKKGKKPKLVMTDTCGAMLGTL